jgi:pseudouridine kinase
MRLTPREHEIVELLRADPLLDAAGLAEATGATKAATAVHLSNLTRKGVILGRGYVVRPDDRAVVVVGGANMDIKAHSRRAIELRTSNPGEAVTTPGGVGRNIAENLARLGTTTHLVAPVGRDAFGDQLVDHARSVGISVDHMVRTDGATGTYLAVLDSDGELYVAVANMAITDTLTVPQLGAARDLIPHADLLVVDGNLPPSAVAWLLDYAAAVSVPVVVDPVSVAKARHFRETLDPSRPVVAMTPNLDELCALVDRTVPNSKAAIAKAARELHARGIEHVWVRRGTRGSLLSSADGAKRPVVEEIPAPAVDVADVTGAGDAMTAGFVHALLRGDEPLGAARFGQMAAALTVATTDTVRADLSATVIDTALRTESESQA